MAAFRMPQTMHVATATYEVETHDGYTATITVTVDLQGIAHTIGGKAIRSRAGISRALQGSVRVNAANINKEKK